MTSSAGLRVVAPCWLSRSANVRISWNDRPSQQNHRPACSGRAQAHILQHSINAANQCDQPSRHSALRAPTLAKERCQSSFRKRRRQIRRYSLRLCICISSSATMPPVLLPTTAALRPTHIGNVRFPSTHPAAASANHRPSGYPPRQRPPIFCVQSSKISAGSK